MTEEEKDYYCDYLCKFREEVFSNIKDCDDAENYLVEHYCPQCILNNEVENDSN